MDSGFPPLQCLHVSFFLPTSPTELSSFVLPQPARARVQGMMLRNQFFFVRIGCVHMGVCQLCVCTNSLPLQVVINRANQLPVSSHHHYLRVKRLPHHTIYGAVVASQKIEHGPLVQLRPIHLAPHAFPRKRRIRQQPHAKQMSSSVAALVSKPLSPPSMELYLLRKLLFI